MVGLHTRPGPSYSWDQGTRGGIARFLGRAGEGTHIQKRATNSTGVETSQYSPPYVRPAWKKRQQKLIKNRFFFYLNRFNKKSGQQTHTHTQTHLKINYLGSKFVFLLHSTVQRGKGRGRRSPPQCPRRLEYRTAEPAPPRSPPPPLSVKYTNILYSI